MEHCGCSVNVYIKGGEGRREERKKKGKEIGIDDKISSYGMAFIVQYLKRVGDL